MVKAQLQATSIRVFLHSMVYAGNPKKLLANIDRFLAVSEASNLTVGFVFFGDCFNGVGGSLESQCVPQKGVHNGCWMKR